MPRNQPSAEAELFSFHAPPHRHRRLINDGNVGWRTAILYDILKEIGGPNWLTTFIALGKLVDGLKSGGGSYYFNWRGYLMTVRYNSIELRIADNSRADLIEQLEHIYELTQRINRAVGEHASNHLQVRRTHPPYLLVVKQTRRKRS